MRAIDVIECDTTATAKDEIRAWACLIKCRLVWHFQGFYQRGADALIESGLVSRNGRISWLKYNELTGGN